MWAQQVLQQMLTCRIKVIVCAPQHHDKVYYSCGMYARSGNQDAEGDETEDTTTRTHPCRAATKAARASLDTSIEVFTLLSPSSSSFLPPQTEAEVKAAGRAAFGATRFGCDATRLVSRPSPPAKQRMRARNFSRQRAESKA